ncbi:hypothetical protein ACEPAG_4001 [Sanghuangporus baumii]
MSLFKFTTLFTANIGIGSLVTLIAVAVSIVSFNKTGHGKLNTTPPIVKISERELLKRPREVYERALAEHGSVIAVKRKGRLEYIVDDTLTHDVLTMDTSFSFEKGTAFILNFHYFNNLYTSYFFEIDDFVNNVIVKRMPLIVEQVFPIFVKLADKLVQETNHHPNTKQNPQYVHGLEQIHRSVSEAMVLVLLGPEFINAKNLNIVEKVVNDMSEVTGLYQNASWWGTTFPSAWRFFTWTRVLFTTIPTFYSFIGLHMWKVLRSECFNQEDVKDQSDINKRSVLEYLAYKYADPVHGRVSFSAFLRITALLLGIIFASIHQTATITLWVIYELALHPEYIPALKEELVEAMGEGWPTEYEDISYEALQNAARLDSFIREVLRMKGDTLAVCRLTTGNVLIGGYTIPKGFLVYPLASLSHFNKQYHGTDAETFNGRRWEGTGKQAVMINQTYFPFGLGRWACPGRTLAVAEIKMIIWAIIRRAKPELKDNSYTVSDPINVTSVPPDGELTLVPN